MAKGGVYRLALEDTRNDKFLVATQELKDYLKKISTFKKADGKTNTDPSLLDIERSHRLHVRSSYKPYVSVTSEYVKVNRLSGQSKLTSQDTTLRFTLGTHTHFISDMVLHIRLPQLTGSGYHYRYCAYPGLRLIKKVKLSSDNVPIIEYVRDDALLYFKSYQHDITQDGLDRLLGQEQRKEVTVLNPTGYNQHMIYSDGPQTRKAVQGVLDLWIPVQAWMCRDPKASLMGTLVSDTQRAIEFDLTSINEIIEVSSGGTVILNAITSINFEAELLVNNLYINPEVQDIFSRRMQFQMIRINQNQRDLMMVNTKKVLLKSVRFPIETMLMGVRSPANSSHMDHWWLMGKASVRTNASKIWMTLSTWNSGLSMTEIQTAAGTDISELEELPSRAGILASNIYLHPKLAMGMYSSYVPNRYTQLTGVKAARDPSVYMWSFSLLNGVGDPSGYYNSSADRELYLDIDVPSASHQNPVEIVISSSAINFVSTVGDKLRLEYAV